jgi:hypothetical protein
MFVVHQISMNMIQVELGGIGPTPKSPIHRSMVESRDGWCFSRGGRVLSDSAELCWKRSGVESAIFGNYNLCEGKVGVLREGYESRLL